LRYREQERQSSSKKLQVKLTNIRDYQDYSMASMKVKVYGIRRGAPKADSAKK
jgi:hypothetical protein